MSNIVSFDDKKKKDFKQFIADNKDKIYANTPNVCLISKNDEWNDETEWDDLFHELSAKEN